MDDRHADRRRRLFEALPAGVETALVAPSPTLRYLAGLEMHESERPTLLVLERDGAPALLLPELEAGRARDALGDGVAFYRYGDATDPVAAAGNAFEDLRAERDLSGRVAAEFRSTRLLEFEVVETAFDWPAVVDLGPAVGRLRARKDDAEIDRMRRAAGLIDEILAATVETVEPGTTEADIEAEMRKRALDSPADGFGVGVVTSGPRTARPHAGTGDRTVEAGDPLMIDAGVVVDGYYSDVTRTFAVAGEPDDEWLEIYDVVRRAARAARDRVAAGVELQAVDRAAREVVEAAGYGEAFPHRVGHGLGLEGHEPPYLVDGNESSLAVGHAFTVEPGVYVDGLGGVRIEDDLVLAGDGPEVLTGTPRDLRVL